MRFKSVYRQHRRRFWLRIVAYMAPPPPYLCSPLKAPPIDHHHHHCTLPLFVRLAYFFNKFSVYSVYLFTYICYCSLARIHRPTSVHNSLSILASSLFALFSRSLMIIFLSFHLRRAPFPRNLRPPSSPSLA